MPNICGFSTEQLETTFPQFDVTIEGYSLRITDTSGGGQNLRIWNSGSATFASDIGIAVDAPVNTVLSIDLEPLRLPTQQYGPGQIRITNRSGALTEIDLTSARSVSDIIKTINNSGAGVTAALNAAGNGLTFTDTSGGSGNLVVADVGSATIAADLGIAGTHAGTSRLETGDLDVRYLSEATRLDAMHYGGGITRGKFIITDSSGVSATVDLTQGDEITVGDVLKEINSRGLQINARINDTGDGILIEDTGPGVIALKVEEAGSTTARDLGILGQAASPGDDLDGSFEIRIELAATDTLDDLVDKIADSGIKVKASVVNDGSGTRPHRLSLLSSVEGRAGTFLFDDGGLGLGATELVKAENALVFYGSSDPAKGIAVTSTTNKLSNVVTGATIQLLGASTSTTRVTITRNDEAIASDVESFVDAFNGIMTTLDKYDTYNAETQTRGLLLGDSTVARIRSSLYNLVSGRNTDVSGQYVSLAQIGVTVGSGAKLQFNSSKLTTALTNDRTAVENLFTLRKTTTDGDGKTAITASGVAVDFSELIKRMTDGPNGMLPSRMDGMDNQIALNDTRIKQMQTLLASKRARLEAQFVAMETALSNIQSQSSALTSLSNLATSLRNNR